MENNNKELINKKESLIKLLTYIDENNLWSTAKHLITYIEKSENIDIKFIDLISGIITEAIAETKDELSKEKLEEISDSLESLKKEELESNKNDEKEADSLINELDNI